MKKIVLGMCFMLFTTGIFAKEFPVFENATQDNLVITQYFDNGLAMFYGCSVYIAWHDSHGSYSHTWSFPNVNTQSGCNQMKDELIAVLMSPLLYIPLNDEELLPPITPEEPVVEYIPSSDEGLLPLYPVEEGEMGVIHR